jgi:hypothetical protein
MNRTPSDKPLVVWIDDLMESPTFSPRIQPLKDVLRANCELVPVATISSLALKLRTLAADNRQVDGILLDMMLTSLAKERNFGALGVDSISIYPYFAGAQIARILLADQYRSPGGDTPAADFIERHRGCKVAVISTCFAADGPAYFEKADANDIRDLVTHIYDANRPFEPTKRRVLNWLGTLKPAG